MKKWFNLPFKDTIGTVKKLRTDFISQNTTAKTFNQLNLIYNNVLATPRELAESNWRVF